MKYEKLSKLLVISVVALVLAACGGGGGSGGLGGGGSDKAAPTLTLTLLDNNGNKITAVNGDALGIVHALLTDGDGRAVSGTVVRFSANLGILTGNGSALTNASGIAEIILAAGTVQGAGVVSASADVSGVSVSSNNLGFQTDGAGAGDDPIALQTDLTLSVTEISRGNNSTATMVVQDSQGSFVQGALVEFFTTNGLLDPLSGAVFTDKNGVAQITIKPGINQGAGSLRATVTSGNDTVEVTGVPFISAGDGKPTLTLTISTIQAGATAQGSTGTISNEEPGTVTALVENSNGALVEGAIVTFNLAGGVAGLNNDKDITNNSGIASVTVSAGTTPGFGSISASTNIEGTTVTNKSGEEVTFETEGDEPFTGEGNSSLSVELSILDEDLNPLSPPALDAETPAILQAIVRNPQGVGVENIIVEFKADLGDMFPVNGLALTNEAGEASVSLNAGSTPGAGAAKADIIIDGQRFGSDSLTYSTLGNAGDTTIGLNLTFTDKTPFNNTNIITLSEPGVLEIRVDDGGGINLPNRKATVTTSLGSLKLGSTTGATIIGTSNAAGRILVSVIAGNSVGTGNIFVTVGDTTSSVQFDVGVDGLQIGRFVGSTFRPGELIIANSPLSAGGTTTASVYVVDQTNRRIPGIAISFSSICTEQNDDDTGKPLAEMTTTVNTDSSGLASATYLAQGCVGNDTVRAVESSSGESAAGTVEVLQAVIGAIRFDSVEIDPSNPLLTSIQVKESGGITTAIVIFQILDVQGNPIEDKNASFELTTNVGGLALINTTGLSDEEGKVRAVVAAGYIPTTVRVRASVQVDTDSNGTNDTTLVTLSAKLTVNTGLPDQNSMSVAATNRAIEGDEYDGEESIYTIRMSDFFNNPVPNGTAVSVTTELGSVTPQCVTVSGSCEVVFTSQEPRTPLDPNVSFRNLYDDQCPATRISAETVTIDGTDGDTEFMLDPSGSVVVRDPFGVFMASTDFEVDTDGSGITCLGGLCADTAVLTITYNRLWLDEDDSGDTTHDISEPGVAQPPFLVRTGAPCNASARNATTVASKYLGGLGQPYGGRSTLLFRAQGEESFIDTNGNGQYDFGEPFVDLPEAFLDKNEDGVFNNGNPAIDDSSSILFPECYGPVAPVTNPGALPLICHQEFGDEEIFIDFGVGNNLNQKFDAGNLIYNGSLCPKDISDRTRICTSAPCSSISRYCTREPVDIRRQVTILLAGSTAVIGVRDGVTGEFVTRVNLTGLLNPGEHRWTSKLVDRPVVATDGTELSTLNTFTIGDGVSSNTLVPSGVGDFANLTTGSTTVIVDVSDIYNGKLPTGTVISVSSASQGCITTNSPGLVVADGSGFGFSSFTINLGPNPAEPLGGSGTVTVSVTTPNGQTSTGGSDSFYGSFECSY